MDNRIKGTHNWGLILVGLGVCVVALALSPSFALNMANLNLIRWSPELPTDPRQLEQTLAWGERSGAGWQHHRHAERTQNLLQQVQGAAWQERQVAWGAYEQAQQFERAGERAAAMQQYREALRQPELRVVASVALYHLAVQQGRSEEADEYVSALKTLEPMVAIASDTGAEPKLLGYDVDTWSIAWADQQILLTVYWQLSTVAYELQQWSKNGWQFTRIGNRLYQSGTTHNLLPNGGFELHRSAHNALPWGYRAQPVQQGLSPTKQLEFIESHHALVFTERAGEISQVAVVYNSGETNYGLASFGIAINGNELLLFHGWACTSDTEHDEAALIVAFYNRSQQLGEIGVWRPLWWSRLPTWQQVGSSTITPAASEILVLFARHRGSTSAFFDDLAIFRVALPQSEVATIHAMQLHP